MEITLSWDLLVILFFAIVTAYSFIVGKDESVKIIIASYIAIVAVQGLGNLLALVVGKTTEMAGLLGLGADPNVVAIVKLLLFVAVIIFLAIKGGFAIDEEPSIGTLWETIFTAAFGFATSGLLLSALLTYVAARPLLDTQLSSAPLLSPLITQSSLVRVMVDYQDGWFALPAVLLIVLGILRAREAA
jgi:hypothetical protein